MEIKHPAVAAIIHARSSIRRELGMTVKGLPRTSSHRGGASWSHILTAWLEWLSRRLRRLKARNESRDRLDLELYLHAQAMTKAFQKGERRRRAEIGLPAQAEEEARWEVDARLEIERVSRREAEHGVKRLSGPARRGDPETIEKAQREMMLRVRAEQLAVAGVGYGVYVEPDLLNRRANSISRSASEQALADAHAEIARLTAECEQVKEELKEALVGVSYGRMCEKELIALRSRQPLPRLPWGKLGMRISQSISGARRSGD